MVSQKKNSQNPQQKKSKIPYFFFAFFAVIFLVNIGYIYISKKTWHGISIKDAYQKGLNYNQTIALIKIQKELGWSLKISYIATSARTATISFDLRDKTSQVIQDAEMFVQFKNVADEKLDFAMPVKNDGGYYSIDVKFPASGQWDVEVTAMYNGNEFRESKRYVIR